MGLTLKQMTMAIVSKFKELLLDLFVNLLIRFWQAIFN